MSANLVIDLGNTSQFPPSIALGAGVGNTPASGVIIGVPVDLKDANTFCNVYVMGGPTSGPLGIQVQTCDFTSGQVMSGGVPPSGSFTDPTSGLSQMPTGFSSGGIFWVNSGLYSLPGGGNVSGTAGLGSFPFGFNPVLNGMSPGGFTVSGSFPAFASGGAAMAGFQRPGRFARVIALSGTFTAPVIAGFISQLKTTGSGGGFTTAPSSGVVSV